MPKAHMIPESKFVTQNGIDFITLKLFKQYHSETETHDFIRWLDGSITTVLTEVHEIGIYVSDYRCWLHSGDEFNA